MIMIHSDGYPHQPVNRRGLCKGYTATLEGREYDIFFYAGPWTDKYITFRFHKDGMNREGYPRSCMTRGCLHFVGLGICTNKLTCVHKNSHFCINQQNADLVHKTLTFLNVAFNDLLDLWSWLQIAAESTDAVHTCVPLWYILYIQYIHVFIHSYLFIYTVYT